METNDSDPEFTLYIKCKSNTGTSNRGHPLCWIKNK